MTIGFGYVVDKNTISVDMDIQAAKALCDVLAEQIVRLCRTAEFTEAGVLIKEWERLYSLIDEAEKQ